MKYKIKEIDFNKLDFKEVKNIANVNGKIVNITYNDGSLEFQTPKMIIDSILEDNGHNFIILKLKLTEACNIFYSRILELENKIKEKYQILTNFNKDNNTFTVKVPFSYSKPIIKIYSKETNFFNYYHLSKNMEVICLLTFNKIWIGSNEECNYNLNVKEIFVTDLKI